MKHKDIIRRFRNDGLELGTIEGWTTFYENLEDALETIVRDTKVTFADNMDEPIHRWFRFPAGFSAKLVEAVIKALKIPGDAVVLDPFTGCGTTNVVAKTLGLRSIGVELHPLLAWVAGVKTYWEYDLPKLSDSIAKIRERIKEELSKEVEKVGLNSMPELLRKCFTDRALKQLFAIKKIVMEIEDEPIRNFHLLALLSTLRDSTDVDVGWPYLLPRKKRKKRAKPPIEAFIHRLTMQYNDLLYVVRKAPRNAEAKVLEVDARELAKYVDTEVDFAFTSPPYLNNYDYADRTRLELYFLGWAKTWRDITEKIRKKLITSCSHQAVEQGYHEGLMPRPEIPTDVREELVEKISQLRRVKYTRGGRKDYDIMVAAYFNDMWKAMHEICEILRRGAYFIMVLGDSAPYGVHIPTDVYLAKIGLSVGFSRYRIYTLRERGHKWSYIAEAGRRHSVKLREVLILFQK